MFSPIVFDFGELYSIFIASIVGVYYISVYVSRLFTSVNEMRYETHPVVKMDRDYFLKRSFSFLNRIFGAVLYSFCTTHEGILYKLFKKFRVNELND